MKVTLKGFEYRGDPVSGHDVKVVAVLVEHEGIVFPLSFPTDARKPVSNAPDDLARLTEELREFGRQLQNAIVDGPTFQK